MVYACYCVYNEEYFLAQSLQSIVPYVDKVIVVDGSWSTFPTNGWASTDNSKTIAKKICGKKLIWVDAPEDGWKTQVDKRNEYIKLVPDGEWFIVFDADEIIFGDVKAEFDKLQQLMNQHYAMVPTRLHTPYFGENQLQPNGLGGFMDVTNKTAARLLNEINTEQKYNEMRWLAFTGHRYALYKKEPEMKYANHHSQIWIGSKTIFEKYPVATNYICNLLLEDLKHLRPFSRWQANLQDRVKRSINDCAVIDRDEIPQWQKDIRKFKRQTPLNRANVKPLMIIRSPRDSDFIKENFATIDTVDQLWVKHYPIFEANQQLLSYVKEHKDEYTHVVFTTDDVTFSKEDFEQLMYDICQYDFPIISGICNFCTTWTSAKHRCDACEDYKEHEWLSATFTPLRDVPLGGYLHDKRTPFLSRETYDFIPSEWAKNNQIIKQVYFQGIALTAIRMDIFLEMDGLHLYNREKRLHADDVDLAIYCHTHGIQQMGDFKILVRHYGRKDIYNANMNTSTNSEVYLIPKSATPELFKEQDRAVAGDENLRAEYELLCEKLARDSVSIPSRPIGEGAYVFDNVTNRSLNQFDWDMLYGKYAKFIK